MNDFNDVASLERMVQQDIQKWADEQGLQITTDNIQEIVAEYWKQKLED